MINEKLLKSITELPVNNLGKYPTLLLDKHVSNISYREKREEINRLEKESRSKGNWDKSKNLLR